MGDKRSEASLAKQGQHPPAAGPLNRTVQHYSGRKDACTTAGQLRSLYYCCLYCCCYYFDLLNFF